MKKAPWNDPTVKWVCEDHPTKEQEHRLFPWFWKRCGGAGMPEPTIENIEKGYVHCKCCDKIHPFDRCQGHHGHLVGCDISNALGKMVDDDMKKGVEFGDVKTGFLSEFKGFNRN